MRPLTIKYTGDCRKCGETLAVGANAIYERHVGVFCPTCAPTDPEDIRSYRQEAADRKADKYEGWAAKRTATATATFNHNAHYTDDNAFNTQPGHIPERARVNRQNDAAYESLVVARRMEGKAERLRHVRVAGDTDRARQKIADAIKPQLAIGQKVTTPIYGAGVIKRLNPKSVTVQMPSGFTDRVPYHWIHSA
jgi:hypothetical protein